MMRDFTIPEVKNVTLVAIQTSTNPAHPEWKVYIVNGNDHALDNVLIASRGYGTKDKKEQTTSTLRHYLEAVPAGGTGFIEVIDPQVFHLTNEYMVTYAAEGKMFDKKFLFPPDTIADINTTRIPELDADGVVCS
jgi:hypothetical protein